MAEVAWEAFVSIGATLSASFISAFRAAETRQNEFGRLIEGIGKKAL